MLCIEDVVDVRGNVYVACVRVVLGDVLSDHNRLVGRRGDIVVSYRIAGDEQANVSPTAHCLFHCRKFFPALTSHRGIMTLCSEIQRQYQITLLSPSHRFPW